LSLMAKYAEKAERYSEAAGYIKARVEQGEPLTEDDRNMLHTIYKQHSSALRKAWRILTAKTNEEADASLKEITRQYRDKVGKELTDVCDTVLNLIDKHIMPKASDCKLKIYCLKMKADYYRYKAEMLIDRHKAGILNDTDSVVASNPSKIIDQARQCYQEAHAIAIKELPVMDIQRIGLVLNISVFNNDIAQDKPQAIKICKETLEECIAAMRKEGDGAYTKHMESIKLLQLISDNLNTWDPDTDDDLLSMSSNFGDDESTEDEM